MADPPHLPVLLEETMAALAPLDGATALDGTFGAGGYARAMLDRRAARVIGVDRDPTALAAAASWAAAEPRLTLLEGRFSELDALAASAGAPRLDAVALDIGVSSMQLDQAERGFSFLRDGPLDMRMGADGETAAELTARASERDLADIFYHYGEERAARRLARILVAARAEAPIETTGALARIVERALGPPKPHQPHPATRAFQALRIAVNGELDELIDGLASAERALAPGGRLAVVTFHSLEDRIVKRFLQERAGRASGGSRHAPQSPNVNPQEASFQLIERRPTPPGAAETAANPRARSAKLRWARRTEAPPWPLDRRTLGAPPAAGPKAGRE